MPGSHTWVSGKLLNPITMTKLTKLIASVKDSFQDDMQLQYKTTPMTVSDEENMLKTTRKGSDEPILVEI